MKRKLSLLLAVVMILGSFSFAFAAETNEAADFLEEKGVLKGDTTGDLMLGEPLERRDAVVLLSRLMGVEEEAKEFEAEGLPTWTDNNDSYYNGFLAWAQSNEYFKGHNEVKFGPRDNITVREYAVVLLRALGYVEEADDWDKVFDTAKDLGLLEGVEAEADDDVLRGQMAVMTFTALGTAMKDSDETLAEFLDIEMPEPEVLEVEEVVADNLKEVKVVFNKSVDEESAINLDNYETDAGDILDITYVEDENMAILLLEDAMKNKEDYELTIDGVEDDKTVLDVTKEFTAVDNAIPEVVDVVGLGTKAVKVVMSEPVKDAKTTNFRLNGKTVYGTPHTAGREIVLKVYSDIEVGEHELTVRNLEDFGGFKSLETIHPFEVVEDDEAPTVANVDAWLERVVVTFSEDVDDDTVSRYSVYWKSGSTKKYPEEANRLAGNKYEFVFDHDEALPAHETTLYVEGVKDYSGNKMVAAEVEVKASIDTTRPAVKEVTIKSDKKTIEIEFTKRLKAETVEKLSNYTLIDEDDNKITLSKATLKDDKKTVALTVGKALDENTEYTLKISGITDNNKYANTMIDYSEVISVGNFTGPELDYVTMDYGYDKTDEVYRATLHLFFTKDMDLSTLANPENYLIQINGSNRPLTKLDGDIDIIKNDGRVVVITIEDEDDFKITGVAGLGLKDSKGKELKNYGEMVDIEEKAFNVVEAVAKAKDKIEVEFTMPVSRAPRGAFSGLTAAVKEVEISGDIVTLKLEDNIKADADSESLKIDGKAVISYNGEELNEGKEKVETLVDKIAPSISSVAAKDPITTSVAIEVAFDEPITVVSTDEYLKTDFVVTRVVETKAIDIESATKTGSNIITLVLKVADVKYDTEFIVEVKDKARFIEDDSENVAKASSKRTGLVTGIEAILAKEDVDAEFAKVDDFTLAAGTELTVANVKTAVEGKVDSAKVTVSVAEGTEAGKYVVTLTHKTVTTVTESKSITVTVAGA